MRIADERTFIDTSLRASGVANGELRSQCSQWARPEQIFAGGRRVENGERQNVYKPLAENCEETQQAVGVSAVVRSTQAAHEE